MSSKLDAMSLGGETASWQVPLITLASAQGSQGLATEPNEREGSFQSGPCAKWKLWGGCRWYNKELNKCREALGMQSA